MGLSFLLVLVRAVHDDELDEGRGARDIYAGEPPVASVTTDAVRTVAFTGHRTKKVTKRVEAQLGVGQ